MPGRQATTTPALACGASVAQRREMMRLMEKGDTYEKVAEQVGVSFWTARKWLRVGKRNGVENLV